MTKQSLFWNKMAKSYSEKPVSDKDKYKKKLEQTHCLLTPNMQVLEIGCGTGSTAIIHSPYILKYTACDFSSEMIKIAKGKALAKNISNIEFKQESVEEMSYPESQFDIIMAHSILHLVKDKEEVLKKIFKSLKPGGYFITSTGCISGLFKCFIPLWFIGFKMGKLPYLGFFSKQSFINLIKDKDFEIIEYWEPTNVDLFLIAQKGGR